MSNIETITYDSHGSVATNATDYYKNWEMNALRDDLDAKRGDMVTVCMNLTNDFNKATVIRNSNAFLGRAVIMVGKRRFDRRGTVGTHHTEHIMHAENFDDVFEYLRSEGYRILAVDNIASYNPVSVYKADIPKKTAFVYGEEMLGLSEDVIEKCDGMVYIPQHGSVRSLNVGVASGIMMGEYARRYYDD